MTSRADQSSNSKKKNLLVSPADKDYLQGNIKKLIITKFAAVPNKEKKPEYKLFAKLIKTISDAKPNDDGLFYTLRISRPELRLVEEFLSKMIKIVTEQTMPVYRQRLGNGEKKYEQYISRCADFIIRSDSFLKRVQELL